MRAVGSFLRRALTLEPGQFDPSAGLRYGVVVGVLMALGTVVGGPSTGSALAAGGLITGTVAGTSGLQRPRATMLLAATGLMVTTFLGSTTANVIAVRLVLLAVLALLGGSVAGLGPAASVVSTLSLVGFVILGRFPRTPEVAVQAGALFLLGGLVQIVVASIHRPSGRIRRPTPRRDVRAAAFAVRTALRRFTVRPDAVARAHAVRLAGTVLAAEALALYWEPMRGYWIALSVLTILKPDWSATTTRGLNRFLGTLVGAALIGLVVDFWAPHGLEVAAPLALVSVLLFSVQRVNYGLFSLFIAADVVLLLSPISGQPVVNAEDRALFTTVGGAMAVLVHYLFRRDTLQRLEAARSKAAT